MQLTEDLEQSSNCGSKVIVLDLRIRIFIQEIYVMQVIILLTVERKQKIQAADIYLSTHYGSGTVSS